MDDHQNASYCAHSQCNEPGLTFCIRIFDGLGNGVASGLLGMGKADLVFSKVSFRFCWIEFDVHESLIMHIAKSGVFDY
ncbi:MAG: hypothetical protein ACRBBV_09590 [Paracoccaceae bacterium]